MVAMFRDVSVADALQAVYDAHKAGEITTTDITNFFQHLFHGTPTYVVIDALSKLLTYYAEQVPSLEDVTHERHDEAREQPRGATRSG